MSNKNTNKNNLLNKFNVLMLTVLILVITVIGQSWYIANLYAKQAGITPVKRENLKLPDQNIQSDKSRNLFDDFDDDFMSNHFKEFRKIKEHMDQVFDDAFSKFHMNNNFDDDFVNIFGKSKINNNLNLNLKNDPDKFIITMKLPNAHKNDVNVKLEGQKLSVSGNVKEQIEEDSDMGKQFKHFSSRFSRSILLPEKVKENTMTTKFEDNNLIITIVKEGSV